MYLLGAVRGHQYQAGLWRLWSAGRLALHDLTSSEMQRMAALMQKYRDTPMDLADASLVAVAESLSMRQVFSLDRDFYIYRLADGTAFEVIR
jgi:predicted nucleic acid-binding protein